jgi:hypothetical protein
VDLSRAELSLHVEELVLQGIEAGDRYLVADALQRELGLLLAGVTPRSLVGRAVDAVDGGVVRVGGAESLGRELAVVVHDTVASRSDPRSMGPGS